MPKRYWIFAVAFGLIVSAGLGQSQEQAQSPGGQAESQQEPTEAYPLPFPVEIVEDEAAADARRNREEEARQREIEDLRAQQGMNAATQAMNRATQRMAEYAYWSTVFVFFGTILLVVTLCLTYQANRAAVRAVKVTDRIGKAQTRAYLSVETATVHDGGDYFGIVIEIANKGQSPAKEVNISSMWAGEMGDFDSSWLDEADPFNAGAVAPGGKIKRDIRTDENPDPDRSLNPSQIGEVKRAERPLWMFGRISYVDAFGGRGLTKFRYKLNLRSGHWVAAICDEGNDMT